MCLAYIVTCVHPLQIVVVLCTLQYYIEYNSTISSFFAFSFDTSTCMPAVVLYYCTFQGTVLFDYKCFIFCVYFLCVICVKKYYKLIAVFKCSTI